MYLRSASSAFTAMRMAAALFVLGGVGCSPHKDESQATPLPTRQTTIDPVNRKLDEAQQDIERRRDEVDRATR
jgi:hypothetical protein